MAGISVTVNGKEQTEPLDIVIRKSYAQSKAAFIVARNCQMEVQELRKEVAALRSDIAKISELFLAVIADRDDSNTAAVAKDLRLTKFRK